MKKSHICTGCWQQMKVPIPLGTPLSWPFKMFGIKRSKMNPNLCTVCEMMFSYVMKKPQVERNLTVLFADLRGYTELSETLVATEMMSILSRFYDESSLAVWSRNGIINKFLGDGVLALFNFPLEQGDHVQKAIEAGVELKEKCENSEVAKKYNLCVGVGVHTGKTSIGKFGNEYKDFTAIGSTVNVAARIQQLAGPGELIISKQVKEVVGERYKAESLGMKSLKGVEEEVEVWKIS